MIVVFIAALMLEIFTIYFIIKVVALNLSVEAWVYFDFASWNLFLTLPTIIVIWIGALASNEARILNYYVGKYSNYCTDDLSLQRVTFSQKFNIQTAHDN